MSKAEIPITYCLGMNRFPNKLRPIMSPLINYDGVCKGATGYAESANMFEIHNFYMEHKSSVRVLNHGSVHGIFLGEVKPHYVLTLVHVG